MNLDHLITFQRLAREKSFLETAVSLGVSQPTVTLRMKELEQRLGKLLVQRIGQQVSLTDAGEEFLTYTNRILRVIDTGKKIVQNYEDYKSPQLRIATTSSISSYVLPSFLEYWNQRHPAVDLHLCTDQSEDVVCMIKDRIADVGIVRGTSFDDSLNSVTLFHDPICLVVKPGHPLSHRKSPEPLSIIDLHKEPIVMHHSNMWQLVNQLFLGRGVSPRIAAELTHVITVKKFIQAGIGVAFLPFSSVRNEIRSGSLHLIQVIETSAIHLPAKAYYLHPAKSDGAAPTLEFISELESFFRSKPLQQNLKY